MNWATWLQDRRIEKFEDVLECLETMCLSARDAAALPGMSARISFAMVQAFAIWLGLIPRLNTISISKMGQCDLRRLLIASAMAAVRWAIRRGRTGRSEERQTSIEMGSGYQSAAQSL